MRRVWWLLLIVTALAPPLLQVGITQRLLPHGTAESLARLYDAVARPGGLSEFVYEGEVVADFRFQGALKPRHPRLLPVQHNATSPSQTAADFKGRHPRLRDKRLFYESPCQRRLFLDLVVCALVEGRADLLPEIEKSMLTFSVEPPRDAGEYGNIWVLALAYDLLTDGAGLSAETRVHVNGLLTSTLEGYLRLLEEGSSSLWHGRNTLAAIAWITAVAMDGDGEVQVELRRKAQAHFLESVRALALTEAWPEGYNYWIQNRAFLFMLAASAYLNGLEQGAHSSFVLATIRRNGLWHIYATRPDNRVEGHGDEGSRVDLKDETRRVIDLLALLSGDSVFDVFSSFIESLHGRASYYVHYRWGAPLFGQTSPPVAARKCYQRLACFDDILPTAEWFGKGAMNLLFVRSGWGGRDTFISFKAGAVLTHHAHYDAGHFTLFKGSTLAVNSSTYGGFKADHRLNYAIRSIAKNTLLIQRPGERVRPNRFFDENVADGGQRLVIPTGSYIADVHHWRSQLHTGRHYAGGRIVNFEHHEASHAYIEADLTDAYNTPRHDEGGSGGKVTRVRRTLIYLYQADQLFVYDRVESIKAAFRKKWLLHTVNRPHLDGLKVLRGAADNGILETDASEALIVNEKAYMHLAALLPEQARIRLVGGPDHKYYVETDGDDNELNGRNMSQGARSSPWFDDANWRLELQPAKPARKDEFLVALTPRLGHEPRLKPRLLQNDGYGVGIQSGEDLLWILKDGWRQQKYSLPIRRTPQRISLVGLPVGESLILTLGNYRRKLTAAHSSVVLVLDGIPDTSGEGGMELTLKRARL